MTEMDSIPISELDYSGLRDIRQGTVDQLKERIEKNGYDPARLMRVVPNGDGYTVADGNHRLRAIKELPDAHVPDEIPVVIHENGDVVGITVEANENEDTFAQQDLFDYLDYIDDLRDDHTQAEIGNTLGWSRSKVSQYTTLLENVATEVLEMARSHQEGRVAQDATNVANFTEGWFRNSGLYELSAGRQETLMTWFCEEKNCDTSQNQVQSKAEELAEKERLQHILENEIQPGVDESREQALWESIEAGEHTESTLKDAIRSANEDAQNRLYYGEDAVDVLPELSANSVACVVMDPPYGTDYQSHRDTENPDFDSDINDTLGLLTKVFGELERVCKANAHLYMFFPMEHYCSIVSLANEYFNVTTVPLIWVKNNHAPTRDATNGFDRMYAHKYEPVLMMRMPNGDQRELNDAVNTNVLEHEIPKGDDRWHDAQKPTSLCQSFITTSTGAGETVLDPFAGSGSTVIAAKRCGRNYIGIEQDGEYESRLRRELNKLSGD